MRRLVPPLPPAMRVNPRDNAGGEPSVPRPRTVSMRTTNALLREVARDLPTGSALPSETQIARRFGVSRTAARAALQRLGELGVVAQDGRAALVQRRPRASDYHAEGEVESRADLVERRFMEMALGGELAPGARIAESELARRIGVSTVSVREFLIAFSRYGVVAKDARGGWRLGAFDRAFAEELAAMRRMFEMDAIRTFGRIGDDDPAWLQVATFLQRHRAAHSAHARDPLLFSTLDREFHRFLVARLQNRFADSFYDIIAFVFHYHYQWDKTDEVARNMVALQEHETVLRALAERDVAAAEQALDLHLATAMRSLIACATSPAAPPSRTGGQPPRLPGVARPGA